MNPLRDAKWVGEILGVSPFRVYELARLGLLPCVRLGRQIRFDPDRLREWIQAGGAAAPGSTAES